MRLIRQFTAASSRRCVPLLLVLALHATPGFAAAAHEHGLARLDVVVDGQQLVISLDSPLANLLGFEHAPRSEVQREAVAKMETALQAAGLFKPDPAAACTPDGVTIDHPFKAQAKGAAAAEHADAEISWRFRCTNPAALRQLDVGLFDRFSGLHSLQTQLAGPRGQTAATLSRRQRVLRW